MSEREKKKWKIKDKFIHPVECERVCECARTVSVKSLYKHINRKKIQKKKQKNDREQWQGKHEVQWQSSTIWWCAKRRLLLSLHQSLVSASPSSIAEIILVVLSRRWRLRRLNALGASIQDFKQHFEVIKVQGDALPKKKWNEKPATLTTQVHTQLYDRTNFYSLSFIDGCCFNASAINLPIDEFYSQEIK